MSNQPQRELNIVDSLVNNEELSSITKCDSLSSFIANAFVDDFNNEKLKHFYNCLPSILLNLYASPITNEQEYWALFNLFSPESSSRNLFSVIIQPPAQLTLSYVLDVSTLLLSSTHSSIGCHAAIIKELLGDSVIQNESRRLLLKSNKLRLPLFEYFLIIFLLSAKQMEYTSRKYLNVLKEEKKTFSSYFKWNTPIDNNANTPLIDIDSKRNKNKQGSQSSQSTLNINRSFQYNFYKNIFEKYLDFLYCNGMKAKLNFLFRAITITWLYDYTIKPSIAPIIFEKGKKKKFSQLFTSIESNTNQVASSLPLTNQLNVKYPNLLLVDCLSSFITFTYQKMQIDTTIFPLRKALFCFMEFLFDCKATYYYTDVHMSDIITLWLNYISPWNTPNENSKVNQSELLIAEFVAMNLPFYIVLLDKCIQAFSLFNKTNEADYIQLSKALLLFSYADRGQGKEVSALNYLPFEQLKSFCLSSKPFSGSELIEKALTHYDKTEINAKQIMLPFVTNSKGRQAANKLILNNASLIQKLNLQDNDDIKALNDTQLFTKALRMTNDIIKELYQIENNENPQLRKGNFISYAPNEKRIYLQSVIPTSKNPWSALKQEGEISVLYHLLKMISHGIDRIRGVKAIDDSNDKAIEPVALTNLRPLCNAFTLLNYMTMLAIVSVLAYTIYSTSNTIKLSSN